MSTKKLDAESLKFVQQLKATIELMDLPQRDAARILGVQQATLSRWINEKFAPRKAHWNDILYKLARPIEKESIRRTPDAYKIDLGSTSIDMRKTKQLLRAKRLFVLDPARVTLSVQTLFEHDADRILAWIKESD